MSRLGSSRVILRVLRVRHISIACIFYLLMYLGALYRSLIIIGSSDVK